MDPSILKDLEDQEASLVELIKHVEAATHTSGYSPWTKKKRGSKHKPPPNTKVPNQLHTTSTHCNDPQPMDLASPQPTTPPTISPLLPTQNQPTNTQTIPSLTHTLPLWTPPLPTPTPQSQPPRTTSSQPLLPNSLPTTFSQPLLPTLSTFQPSSQPKTIPSLMSITFTPYAASSPTSTKSTHQDTIPYHTLHLYLLSYPFYTPLHSY